MLLPLLSLLATPANANPQAPEPAVRTETVEGGVRIVPDREVPRDAREAQRLLLEFGDTNLYDLTLFFADVMRLNFLVSDEKALEGKSVQLIGHTSMSIEAAWEAYLSALRAHDFTTAVVGDLVTVVPSKDARRRSEEVRSGRPRGDSERIVTQLLPLENGTASDLLSIVQPLLSDDAEVLAYAPANTLIVTDSESNVAKVADLVEELSVAAPATTLEVLPLRHAVASEVRAVIEALYPAPQSATKTPTRPTRKTRRTKAPTTTTPTAAGQPSAHITKVLDDERTNSLIVLASPEGHAAVAELLLELDVDSDGSQLLHVLPLTYAMAEEVEAVLTKMASSGGQTTTKKPAKGGKAEPDLGAALSGATFAADPNTNSLAVLATEPNFAPIEELVEHLDAPRSQVFVDAVFVELTSSDGKEVSLSAHAVSDAGLFSSQPDSDSTSFSVTPDLLSGLAAGVFGQLIEVLGPTGELLSVPTFGIALRALQTDGDVHIAGNPAILVLDHTEAVLSVGQKIPYLSSTALSSLGSAIESYDQVDVGMELKVTPHINDGDLVTLNLELNVDEVDESATSSVEGGGPTTSERSVTTDVMVEDGQTIVIAGMTSTKLELTESKVPILGDIPLIGALFRSKSRESRNSNLMVFLTPHIVEDPADLLAIRRIKEAQRQEFVRRFQSEEAGTWLDELNTLLAEAD